MEHSVLSNRATADRRGSLKEYGLVLGVTLLALQARFALDPFRGDHLPFVTFLGAVAVTTYYGGLGSSLAAVLGGLAASWRLCLWGVDNKLH